MAPKVVSKVSKVDERLPNEYGGLQTKCVLLKPSIELWKLSTDLSPLFCSQMCAYSKVALTKVLVLFLSILAAASVSSLVHQMQEESDERQASNCFILDYPS